MPKTAPCFSKKDYYGYFHIDMRGLRVLDIGSSIGSFNKSGRFNDGSKQLEKAIKYITIDIDPASGADIIADAHKLPFKDGSFDLIVANNVIEHFYDTPRAVSEMRRVLAENGRIYFTVPFLYPVHEAPHDYIRLTRFGLERLFENFNDVEIYSRGGYFSTSANFIFKLLSAFKYPPIVASLRMLIYPFLWIYVQLDRFDDSEAFTRVYFGSIRK